MLEALERHIAQGEWLQAKREAERLMLCRDLTDAELGRVYGFSGRACVGLAQYSQAITVLKLACAYAVKSGDWDALGRARGNLGVAQLSLGEYDAAWESFRDYLMDLGRYGEARRFEGQAHYNLGLIYRYRGNYETAAAAYLQASAIFDTAGNTHAAAMCRQNLATVLCVAGKAEAALPYIVQTDALCEALPADFGCEQLLVRARYYREVGDQKSALACLNELLAPKRAGLTATQKAEAHLLSGILALDRGDRREAELGARAAIWLAGESSYGPLIRAAQELLDRVRNDSTQNDSGRDLA